MKTIERQAQGYKQSLGTITLSYTPSPKTAPSWGKRFNYWLTQMGNYLANLTYRSNEPKIYLKRDRNGTPYWQVFDPVTGYHRSLDSELEVRIWLENRYYAQ